MRISSSLLSVILVGVFSSLATGAACPTPTPPPGKELNNTDPFTIMALNASYPYIDGLFVWTQSGYSYLDRGVQNPRYSYPITAKLEDNKLIRIPVSGDPGAANIIGNLNFGTSNVCCNYAQLRWSSKENIGTIPRTSPFFIDARGNLVFEIAPYRQPWYVCGKNPLPGNPGDERILYYGLPYYDFKGEPEKYCVRVDLAMFRTL
ncbi:hypothetical protein BGX38DRAFT_1300719 [Terfezia claveryi]|nr:hypothetical protein BGX38DRAFT_1300719 [Terfezia claveryi]